MATEIKYNDSVIATVEVGKTKILKCKGKRMKDDVEVKAGSGSSGGANGTNGLPIEIDTLDNALLVAKNDGKVYKCDDKLYQVNKITSLKGLTIKFNEHITPCPVIGEDDVFECSGVAMGDDFVQYGNPHVTTIRKRLYCDTSVTADIAFTIKDIDTGDENCYSFYDVFYNYNSSEENPVWLVYDENGNVVNATTPAVIYNFDCLALNENREFIEWVFENAKVYPNFESPNEIKSFKLVHPSSSYVWAVQDAFRFAMQKANRTAVIFEFDVKGQYTASFTVNGELITKTFTNVNIDGYGNAGFPAFSNGDGSLTILYCFLEGDGNIYDENGYVLASGIKYNDIYLDEIEFTKFECMLNNKTHHILSFILCHTTVGGEYHNGYAFKEFTVGQEYDGTVEVE